MASSSRSPTTGDVHSRQGEVRPRQAAIDTPGEARPRQAAIGTPVRALLERLGAAAEACAWQSYLPPERSGRVAAALRPALKGAAPAPAPGLLPFGGQEPGGSGVAGNVWVLSRDAAGCRRVQHAFEEADGEEGREALAAELHGHVWEGFQCPHANHVIQKCIMTLQPRALQFIIDEMTTRGGVSQAARHKYGCRIVQRLVEYCPWTQTLGLVECILSEVSVISRHPYGNYVMQNLLEHGTQEHRRRIMRVLESDVRGFGSDPYGCAVISAAMLHASAGDRSSLAAALVRESGLLLTMACSRLGHGSTRRVLEVLSPADHEEALRQLFTQADSLRASRFGRHLLESLEAGRVTVSGGGAGSASQWDLAGGS